LPELVTIDVRAEDVGEGEDEEEGEEGEVGEGPGEYHFSCFPSSLD
jgi:hypothetical protein